MSALKGIPGHDDSTLDLAEAIEWLCDLRDDEKDGEPRLPWNTRAATSAASDDVVERVAKALAEEHAGPGAKVTDYDRLLACAAISALHGEEMREKIARVVGPIARKWIYTTPHAGPYHLCNGIATEAASAIMALIGLNKAL